MRPCPCVDELACPGGNVLLKTPGPEAGKETCVGADADEKARSDGIFLLKPPDHGVGSAWVGSCLGLVIHIGEGKSEGEATITPPVAKYPIDDDGNDNGGPAPWCCGRAGCPAIMEDEDEDE